MLDRGPFCGPTGTLCFRLWMTLPMNFKVRVDRSLPALFCCLRAVFPRVISGCQDRASNPDRSPLRRARYHCSNIYLKICLIRIMARVWYLLSFIAWKEYNLAVLILYDHPAITAGYLDTHAPAPSRQNRLT